MKIYHKKGFIFGVLWAIMGIWLLLHAIIGPEPEWLKQGKDIVIGILLLAIGVTTIGRAFSKKASQEDYIEQQDERNRWIQLKTKAKMLDIMFGGILFLLTVGLIGYLLTENIAWGYLFFGPCLLLAFYWVAYLVINVYYERHE